jgi:hypothetical protein
MVFTDTMLLLFVVCLRELHHEIHPSLQALPLLLVLVLNVPLHLLQAMLRSRTQPRAVR